MKNSTLLVFASFATASVMGIGLGGCASSSTRACNTNDDCPQDKECVLGRCVDPQQNANDAGADAWVPPVDAAQSDASQSDASTECAEAVFEVTQTDEEILVPPLVTFMHIKAWGAGGNNESCCDPDIAAGMGGYTEAVFGVSPGDSIVVVVGTYGNAAGTPTLDFEYGFGSGSGGGGLAGVFRGPAPITETDYDRAYVIAGGGGGAGYGPSGDTCRPGGAGNAPDSGGMPTMVGGVGLDDGVNGGGGGYRGGLGAPVREAGKGGQGFIHADAEPETLSPRHLEWAEPLDGLPPNTTDEKYDGVAGQQEQSGLVVITFSCTRPPVQ